MQAFIYYIVEHIFPVFGVYLWPSMVHDFFTILLINSQKGVLKKRLIDFKAVKKREKWGMEVEGLTRLWSEIQGSSEKRHI